MLSNYIIYVYDIIYEKDKYSKFCRLIENEVFEPYLKNRLWIELGTVEMR